MNPLIQRMNEISNHLKQFKEVKCLLGLGSLSEVYRLDEYSDLDFFLIVENEELAGREEFHTDKHRFECGKTKK